MEGNLRAVFSFGCFVACAVTASPALADDDVTSGKLSEVVVTATQTEMGAADAPANVSVVTEQEMAKRGAVQVNDALKDLASVYVRDFAGGAPSAWANQVVIRGIPGYYRTSVMVDGIPINNAFSSGVNWSLIDPESVKQIEVVRGPFSSLYGGSAMGGAINIITKKPAERQVTVKAGYGTDNLISGHADYSDRIGEKLGLRLDAGYKQSDGYIKDLVVRTARAGAGGIAVERLRETTTDEGDLAYIVGDKGPRSWWQQNLGAQVTLDVTDYALLRLGVRYHKHETDFENYNTYLTSGGVPVVSGTIDVGGGNIISLSEGNFTFGPNGETTYRYTLGYEHEFSPGVIFKLDAGYSDNTYFYISGNSSAAGGPAKYVDVPNTRLTGTAQLSFPFLDSHYIVAGVSASWAELNKRESDMTDWRDTSTITSLRYRADGESRTYAAFLQDEIALRDNLTFYLGARFDYWETEGEVEQYTAPAYSATYDERNKSAISPKAAVVFKPIAGTTLRASAGRAFRAPTLSDMYSTWVTSSGALRESNPDLKPETTTAFEVGVEQEIGGRAMLSATLFYNLLQDLIYQQSLPGGDTLRVNAGEAVVQGGEVELGVEIVSGISIFANYTYSDTEITENDAEPETVGKRLTYVPEHAASAGIEVSKGGFFGSLIGRYAGKVYGDSENLDVVDGVYGSYDPYFVLDAKLGYEAAEWLSASLTVTNLLDEDYFQSSVAPPRTFFGEVTLRF